MAIFSAGCIKSTDNSHLIRSSIYNLAKHDLDAPSMKVSVRKSPTCINYIAFLPKEKITHENILKAVSESESRTVIIFELDYKHVGVVCEYQRIIDYILDKPNEFAQERGYETRFVTNNEGVKLISFNLDNNSRETRAGFISLGFTILLTTSIFYSGYYYMQNMSINKDNKTSLEQQYKTIVKKEFERSSVLTHKIDMVDALEDVELLTKATHAKLRQVKYDNKNICVEVKTVLTEPFISLLPKNTTIKHRNNARGIVQYCYEKI